MTCGPHEPENDPVTLEEQRKHLLSGAMYNDLTEELGQARQRAVELTDDYNRAYGRPPAERVALLGRLLRHVGAGADLQPTFRCEFGFNISVGDRFFANFDCVMLDGAPITIGDDVLFGPRVSVYTSNHTADPDERAAGACYARPVTIGDKVWLGGGVTLNPGVTIGAGSIVGAGSVVTRDVPAGTIAVGVPARVLRPITEADRTGFRP